MNEASDTPRENQAASLDIAPPTQISAAIDKILANPELISMVASALGGTSPEKKDTPSDTKASATDNGSGEVTEEIGEKTGDMIATLAPILSSLQGKSLLSRSPANDKRACLLNALKPYLCRERCEAIDYMIKLSRISELLKNIT